MYIFQVKDSKFDTILVLFSAENTIRLFNVILYISHRTHHYSKRDSGGNVGLNIAAILNYVTYGIFWFLGGVESCVICQNIHFSGQGF